ncbi:hypothetical protein BS50DRAFT_216599 [Corynespora cassiicola Philippines]|uniref:Uncharacterized protein n=1 Tax=Corynespora cassiicola Philippines TaxID=1448308 RepID=A0A2T2N4N9_CORCC|nr:hypothetical protein BS50DRAFT_216599 [Corynespora cassiicola Philippines]
MFHSTAPPLGTDQHSTAQHSIRRTLPQHLQGELGPLYFFSCIHIPIWLFVVVFFALSKTGRACRTAQALEFGRGDRG